jgi:hypothetical protein
MHVGNLSHKVALSPQGMLDRELLPATQVDECDGVAQALFRQKIGNGAAAAVLRIASGREWCQDKQAPPRGHGSRASLAARAQTPA